jgi:leucyl-tRNA synthetase
MKSYDHKSIEAKWQQQWREQNLFNTNENPQDKMYILVEFPYPSGDLHVGHWYAFAVTDIFARYMHHVGKDVLFPIGFDSFGLPAENAAIKRGLNPKTWTYSNMEVMTKQLESMGTMFDWNKKVVTSDPSYYKWTQWLFLQFYKKGLVHHQQTHVNWCPSCKTILANEQLEAGVCERCGSSVEQKQMMQWNIAITDYADKLIDDLDQVAWPEHIKEAQKNWIGRSTGAYFTFDVESENGVIPAKVGIQDHNAPQADFINAQGNLQIKVFTTRPDTLFGVTYVVIAPEHELVQKLKSQITNWSEVEEYITKTNQKTDLERQATKEKTGVQLQGILATHPATGESIPVFIADYALARYGTGCVMAVPAHDERDFEFATKYNLPIKQVIRPIRIDSNNPPQIGKKDVYRTNVHAFVRNPKDNTYLCLKWKKFDWNTFIIGGVEENEDVIEAAKREVREETGYKNIKFIKSLGESVEAHYFAAHKDENRISISIPVLFELIDEEREEVTQEELAQMEPYWSTLETVKKGPFTCSELDVWLDRLENTPHAMLEKGTLFNSTEFNGLSSEIAKNKITERYGEVATTYKLQDWSVSRQRYWGCPIPMLHCEKCGVVAVPEDQLPIQLPEMEKIEMRDDGKSPLAHNVDWMTTTCPTCGGIAMRETDTLDTFVDSSWYYTRYTDPTNTEQFASKESLSKWMPIDFYSGGSEHTTRHLLYARFVYKVMHDLGLVSQSEPFLRRNNRGLIIGPDGNKMSKSKGNVINPDEVIEKVGADVVRSYLAFIGPYNEAGNYPWDPNGVVGIRRFFERVCSCAETISGTDSRESLIALNTMLSQITYDFEQLKLNTALSKLMICLNVLEKNTFSKNTFQSFLIVLNTFAPHISQELWLQIEGEGFIHTQKFPSIDQSVLQEQLLKIAVQVNGKTRTVLEIHPNTSKEEVLKQAKESPEVLKWIEGKVILKEISVPSKLVSLVVSEESK